MDTLEAAVNGQRPIEYDAAWYRAIEYVHVRR